MEQGREIRYLTSETWHYTRKEKLQNWFYYYKWWLALVVFLLSVFVCILCRALGVGQIRPDYTLAAVTPTGISGETAEALSRALETFGEDLNGDGRVRVNVVQYKTGAGADAESSYYYGYAAEIELYADINDNISQLFLLSDPRSFQLSVQALADAAGNLPDDADYSVEGRTIPWTALGLALGEPADSELAGLQLGIRGWYDETKVPYEAYRAFWERLTERVQ